jgi:hypothetical protein
MGRFCVDDFTLGPLVGPDGKRHAMSDDRQVPRSWFKSTISGEDNCVEAAIDEIGVSVRNSKEPAGPTLRFSTSEWTAFLAGVRAGEFDL